MSHLSALTMQSDCSFPSGMSGDFSVSHLSCSKLRGFELNSTAFRGIVKSERQSLPFGTSCIISDTTGMMPQLQTETVITRFDRSARLPRSLTTILLSLHDNRKWSLPQSRAWLFFFFCLCTCIADYHLLSRPKDKPNHHQSSSLHFFPQECSCRIQKKTFRGCRQDMKSQTFQALQLVPSTKAPVSQ